MKTTESEKSYNQYVKNRLTQEASQEQGKEKRNKALTTTPRNYF